MKKALLSIIAFAAITATVASCNKCNSCTINNTKTDYCTRDNNKNQIDYAERACTASGGVWE